MPTVWRVLAWTRSSEELFVLTTPDALSSASSELDRTMISIVWLFNGVGLGVGVKVAVGRGVLLDVGVKVKVGRSVYVGVWV
jgi:hypothetical protein